ncbi:class E sortase [Frankia sp. AgPm24]|nr:class E sortase [Frankia sp. AgPm24]
MADASSIPMGADEQAADGSVAGPPTQRAGSPADGWLAAEGGQRDRRGRGRRGRGGGPGGGGPGGGGRPVWVGRLGRGLSELLMTAGVLVVLFLVYQLWVTDLFAARTQDRLHHELEQSWSRPAPRVPAPSAPRVAPPPPVVPLGDGVAILRVPRLGRDYAPVVVQGVSAADLRRGPGHIPGTAMPGQIGNFVVSGHRTTYGKPFNRLDELKPGDAIVVEVQDRYYTYRVSGSEVVTPNRVDVTYPVPKHAGEVPAKSLITLTTCHPEYSASHRLIVYGELVDTTAKSAGPPPALAVG